MPPAAGAGRGRVGPSRPPLPPLALAVYAASSTTTSAALSRHGGFYVRECIANLLFIIVSLLITDQHTLNEEDVEKKNS